MSSKRDNKDLWKNFRENGWTSLDLIRDFLTIDELSSWKWENSGSLTRAKSILLAISGKKKVKTQRKKRCPNCHEVDSPDEPILVHQSNTGFLCEPCSSFAHCNWKLKHKEEVKQLHTAKKEKKKEEAAKQRAEKKKQTQEAKQQWEQLLTPISVPPLNDFKADVLKRMLKQKELHDTEDLSSKKRLFLIRLYQHHHKMQLHVFRQNLARKYMKKRLKELHLPADEKCDYVIKFLPLIENAIEDLNDHKEPSYEDKALIKYWNNHKSRHSFRKEAKHQEHDGESFVPEFEDLLAQCHTEVQKRAEEITDRSPEGMETTGLQRTLSMMPNQSYVDPEFSYDRIEDL